MLSTTLVVLQFGLMALVVLRAGFDALGPVSWGLLLASTAVFVWALAANRPGNFNVRPEPKAGGHLVSSGPYRWIRHPMYLGVVLFTAAFAAGGDRWQWVAFAALALVLHVKARREEAFLLLAHPGYADYRARTKSLLPFLV